MSENVLGRKIISRGGALLSRLLLGTKLKDMTSGFQLFSRPALEGILRRGLRSRGPFFQTEMKVYCHHLRVIEVPIRYSGGSHHIGISELKDSFVCLWYLFRQRLQGRL